MENILVGGSIMEIDKNEYDIITNEDKIIINDDKQRKCFLAEIYDNEILLQSFGYSQICTTDKQMERQEGTKAMMKALIKYIKKHHPLAKKIILSDESFIDCEGEKFNLYPLYMLKYEKPYYMQNFSYEFMDKKQKKIYEKNLVSIKQNLTITKTIINKFTTHMNNFYDIKETKLSKFNKSILNQDLKNIVKIKQQNCLYLFELINYYLSKYVEFKIQFASFYLNLV